ncbi:carbohydrate ABC transporter substrate-binding protein (CUT1 family) [Paenibacillus taihuensis]|uniref:Maltodextrin-binding protein n=1 Tax=Paenibacillus taihuensis TaxID=1156355 RepID=A0A3D9SK95_9BACL|nr:maltose ABC transporter substrate-binding protein [Paenibacillus taihuensis]REE91350.1 carbohydrate ABC transporter substrate-binding protein (CUT1 family) [Paenibacillus taihuensis]
MNKKNLMIMSSVLAMSVVMSACGASSENNGGNNAAADTTTNTSTNANTTNAADTTDNAANSTNAVTEELKPEEGAKLVVWYSASEKQLIEEAAKEFKEKYGIDVEYQDVGPDKSIEKITTDGPAGVGADVFLAVHDRLGSAVQAGVVLPNEVFAEETKANNSQKAVDAQTIDGQLYGYPMNVETTAVFYNKDLVPNGEAPKTWDEVINFAKTYNDAKNDKYAYMWEAGNGYWSWGIFGGYGSYVFGKDGTDANDIGLNNEGGVEAAKFFSSLKDAVLPIKAGDIKGDIKTSLFTSGKLAMNVSGPWQTQEFKNGVKNLGVAEFPTLPNGQPMMPFSGVKGFYVNAYSKYPVAANLFAELVSSEKYQLRNFELFGTLPSNNNVINNEKVSSDPFASVFLKQFNNSTPMPKIAEMNAFWSTQEAVLTSLWNDKADAKATMDDWSKKMKDASATSK